MSGDAAKSTYRLYASEQRGTDSKDNRLLIFNVDVNVKHLTAAETLLVSEGSKSPFFGKSHVKEIIHPMGEINKIRECPSHPELVATHSDTPEVFVWNVDRDRAGGTPDLTLTGHTEQARFALSWATEGACVASGGEDCTVCLWDLGASITSLLSKEGRAAGAGAGASGSESKAPAPSLAASSKLTGHEATVEDVCFAPGRHDTLASVGDDRMLLLWDTRSGTRPVATVKNAHGGDVQAVDWCRADPMMVATGGQDGVVKIWDVRELTKPREIAKVTLDKAKDESSAVTRVEWAPKRSDMLACATDGGQAVIYSLTEATRALRPLFRHLWHDAGVEDLHWNPYVDDSEALIASCSEQDREFGGGSLHVWRVSDLITMPEDEAVKALDREFVFQSQAQAQAQGQAQKS